MSRLTLDERLETYRQMASSGATVGVAASSSGAQSSAMSNFSTSNLVERTQGLREWLKQAKAEHELLCNQSNKF